ncbi:MAG: EscU/YscU/HrcU family type III secretion system export apparatus switch protein [Defluviitaleaceae bacterium]|nr:EscU/YscU/HrcU family type III secretion system export apparatus switch protein [Defluviitaleaceae bacterium]
MENKEKRLRQKAVAIHYNSDEDSPRVVAKGAGVIADKILEKAKDTEVKVYQDAKLVEELTKMDLGQHIPPELYEVVAQVLVFINELDRQAGRGIEQKLDLDRLKPIEADNV